MKRLIYRLWGGEPVLRFIVEAVAMILGAWGFILAYGQGYESRVLLYSVEAIAAVMVVDFTGFAALYFWEGR